MTLSSLSLVLLISNRQESLGQVVVLTSNEVRSVFLNTVVDQNNFVESEEPVDASYKYRKFYLSCWS
jgi:hypothetical protein